MGEAFLAKQVGKSTANYAWKISIPVLSANNTSSPQKLYATNAAPVTTYYGTGVTLNPDGTANLVSPKSFTFTNRNAAPGGLTSQSWLVIAGNPSTNIPINQLYQLQGITGDSTYIRIYGYTAQIFAGESLGFTISNDNTKYPNNGVVSGKLYVQCT